MTGPRFLFLLVVLFGGLGVVAAASPAAAQTGATPVYENVTENTTWTAEEGPYRVVEDVTVGPEATLSVGPGTTVEVAEGVTVSVAGELRANGTADAPVRFVGSGTDPVPGEWEGIRTVGTETATVSLSRVDVSGATNALVLDNPSADVDIVHATIGETADAAIRARQAAGDTSLRLHNVTVADARAGIAATRSELLPVTAVSGWTVTESTFRDLEGAAIDLHASRILRLSVTDTRFAAVDGPALSLDAERLRTATVRGNEVDRAQTGLAVEAGDVSALSVRENHIAPVGTGVDLSLERNVHDLVVLDNEVAGGEDGLAIDHDPRDDGYYSFDLQVARNALRDVAGDAVRFRSSLFSDMDLAVENNTVADAGGYGILLTPGASEETAVRNNTVRGTGDTGLHLAARHVRGTAVVDNAVRDAGLSGIDLRARQTIERARIDDNDLLNNARDGLAVQSGSATAGNYTVGNNRIAANAYGVVLAGPQTARLTNNAVVHNTVASGPLIEREVMASGVGVLVRDGAENVTLTENDVYGNRAGLATVIDGTVHARENYWGAQSGPYHPSINPEGEGDAIVTTEGWVAVVKHREERVHRAYERPVAALAASPERPRVNQTVEFSGANASDPDGTVTRYRFAVENETSVSESVTRNATFAAPGTYEASLWVEDEMGIESAHPARLTLSVEETERTTSPETTPASGTPRAPSTTSAPEREAVGVFGWFGGLLGGAFYGIAVVFGIRGLYQTLTERPLSVRGRRVQLYAVLGVAVWALTSLLGPTFLRIFAGAALLAWVLGTGVAYVTVQLR